MRALHASADLKSIFTFKFKVIEKQWRQQQRRQQQLHRGFSFGTQRVLLKKYIAAALKKQINKGHAAYKRKKSWMKVRRTQRTAASVL